ncbi:CGNR zinc finger domain-containing protein [Kocuria rosea]|uniref:CGNR zinc finger domain-containing protein n=1 Tax=Kocuria rosea TaxID=1275 RepID=UPI003D350200
MAVAADRGRARGLILNDDDVQEHGLGQLQDFLAQWVQVIDLGEENARAAHLNVLLATYTQPVSVTNHAGDGWHMHFRSDALPAHRIMMAFITAGTALHFVHRGIHRLRRCERQACGTAFADFSRPGTQRYCSRACANADAVRRHRQRSRARHQETQEGVTLQKPV